MEIESSNTHLCLQRIKLKLLRMFSTTFQETSTSHHRIGCFSENAMAFRLNTEKINSDLTFSTEDMYTFCTNLFDNICNLTR